MELSDGNSDGQEHECENEVTLILDELAAKFTGLANSKNDSAMDDDEEGAIQVTTITFSNYLQIDIANMLILMLY